MKTNKRTPATVLMDKAEKEYLCLKGIVTEYLSQESVDSLRERFGGFVNLSPEMVVCRKGVPVPAYIPADCARYIHLRYHIPADICHEFVNKQVTRYNEKCKIT